MDPTPAQSAEVNLSYVRGDLPVTERDATDPALYRRLVVDADVEEAIREGGLAKFVVILRLGLRPEHMERLLAALRTSKRLRALSIQNCPPAATGVYAHLGRSLSENSLRIESLTIERAFLTDEQGLLIALALASNTRLRSLSLKSNLLGSRTAQMLCHTLSGNETLTRLDLCKNEMGDRSLFGPLLVKNQTLRFLGMPSCACACPSQHSCDLAAMQCLAEGLSLNHSIEKLIVQVTHKEAAEGFMRALELNYTLKFMDVSPQFEPLAARLEEDRTAQRALFSKHRRAYDMALIEATEDR